MKMNRFLFLASILALPLLLSNCAEKNNLGKETVAPELSSQVAESSNFWSKLRRSRADKEGLPPERLQALGDLALVNGDYGSSLVNYLEILKKNPKRYDLHYKMGVIFLVNGQMEGAKSELALVLVHQPGNLLAHEALGLVFLEEKKYPAALDEFQKVLSQDSSRANTHYLMGITYLEWGQRAKALAELRRSVALNPRLISSYVAMSQAYAEMKDYPKAVAVLKPGLALDPKDKRLNYRLGMALAGQGRYSAALEAFTKAGDEAQAYNNIGVHYFMAGHYEEAAKCFQRAIELRPVFYQEAKTNLQRALEKLQQTRKDDS
jgi:tetratricopeptide (TPR) repeat protein